MSFKEKCQKADQLLDERLALVQQIKAIRAGKSPVNTVPEQLELWKLVEAKEEEINALVRNPKP